MAEGVPQYRVYYQDVKSVKAIAERTVRIEMKQPNREQLFSLAQSTRVLPKHYWQYKNLAEPLNEPPVGSGAYQIVDFKPGQSVTYKLNPTIGQKICLSTLGATTSPRSSTTTIAMTP